MKFSAARETLLKPLQTVVGVVERRQTMPILSNVLLSVQGTKLSITATDLEVEMVAEAEVKAEGDERHHGPRAKAARHFSGAA